MDAVIFTKCTYTLATCSISCLLCRCGRTERLNKMVAACKLMRRAGGGCIGHSERILESGVHNLLHSSTKGHRTCISGPRHGVVEPGQLGRVRARIEWVARKKLYEKNERVCACPGTLLHCCGFCLSPPAETHPVATGVLRASLRLDRDSDVFCRCMSGFPTVGLQGRVLLKPVPQRRSRTACVT